MKIVKDNGETVEMKPKPGKLALTGAGMLRAAEAGGKRQVTVVVTTSKPDRAGDVIVTSGIDTSNYLKNPIVLFQHRTDSPVARCVSLTTLVDKMEATAEFPDEGVDELSDRVYRLVKAGILNAVSIGVNPKEGGWEWVDPSDPWNGIRYNQTEMLEFSFVSLPMNAEALIIRREMGEETDKAEIERAKGLLKAVAEEPEMEPEEGPEDPEIEEGEKDSGKTKSVTEDAQETPQGACNSDAETVKSKEARLRQVEVLRRKII